MALSLKQWKEILPKEAYEQLERQYTKATSSNQDSCSIAFNERHTCNEPLAAKKVARFNSKVIISIHSKRNRLLDIDNLFAKYVIDGLRYAGILADDTPQFIEKIVHTQEKSKLEETIITIEEV
jgi:hypothetical protein